MLQLETQRTRDRVEIMAGRPRCGRWMSLLLQGAAHVLVDRSSGGGQVVAMGVGEAAALAAQLAAVVEAERFAAVAAIGGIDSIESLAEGVAESHSLQMLPGALRWFDEADVAAALAPLAMVISDVRDKHGKALSGERLQALHDWPAQRYGVHGRGEALTLKPGPLPFAELAEWVGRTGR